MGQGRLDIHEVIGLNREQHNDVGHIHQAFFHNQLCLRFDL